MLVDLVIDALIGPMSESARREIKKTLERVFTYNSDFFNSGFFSNTLFFSFSPIILSRSLSKTSSLIISPSFSFAVICSTEISSFSIVSARFSDILSRFLGINPCILKKSRFTSL